MLTSLRKFTLQKEGYTARKEGAACPYEDRSDEWYHWQTGWLMHRYEEEATTHADILLPDSFRDDGRSVRKPPPQKVKEPPPAGEIRPRGYVCPTCKTLVKPPAPAGVVPHRIEATPEGTRTIS